jgi:hypothetical protein
MSIEYKLLYDNNKNPVNDNYFITDSKNKYIIFKSLVTPENNEKKFIDKLKNLIDKKFSAEDQIIANNNLISFFVNQTDNPDDNELYSYEYNNTSISILMNPSMMKNWSLDNYETKIITMEDVNRQNLLGGSSSNRYARDRHRYRHTGGYEYPCHHLIPDNNDLLYIYNNNEPFKTKDEINLMLEYVQKHQKELEIYYAIKEYIEKHQKELEIYYAIKKNEQLEQFLNKIPFSKLKKQ